MSNGERIGHDKRIDPAHPRQSTGQFERAAASRKIALELDRSVTHKGVMNASSARRAVLSILALVLICVGVLQWRHNQKLRGELRWTTSELAQARKENAELKQQRSNITEKTAQSGVGDSEVLRLRNRIAELGRELRQKTTDVRKSAGTNKTYGATEIEEGVKYPFLKTAVTNRVPYGQTLVVGGWTSPTGKRAFVIATPALQTPDGPQQRVHLQYLAVTAEESFWERVGWGTLKSDGDNSVAGLLTPEQAEALLQALKQTKEAEVSNRVETSLVEGGKATFGWSTTDGGGSTLLLAADILAHPVPDRQSTDLEIRPAR